MALIKLAKTNETGGDAGVLIVNTDQIVAIGRGANATEIHMTDGRTRWVKDAPEEIVALAKAMPG